jgi:hypothetical protein
MSTAAAQTLARGRKQRNWTLIWALAVTVMWPVREFQIRQESREKERIAIIDPSTGEEVIEPVVDSVTDTSMLEFLGTYCAKAIEDRNPAGLDHALLVPFLFAPDAQKTLNDDWTAHQHEYSDKNMRTKIEIISLHHQPITDQMGPAVVSTIIGQEISNGYDSSGKLLTEVRKVKLTLLLRANPYRRHKNRYPMACFGFEKADDNEVASK